MSGHMGESIKIDWGMGGHPPAARGPARGGARKVPVPSVKEMKLFPHTLKNDSNCKTVSSKIV